MVTNDTTRDKCRARREPWGATPAEWRDIERPDLIPDIVPVVCRPVRELVPYGKGSPADPSKGPTRYYGKSPDGRRVFGGIKGWTTRTTTRADIREWAREPDYGIGLIARTVRAVDVDTEDPAIAEDVELFIAQYLGRVLPARRRAGSSKYLVMFRMPGDFAKRVITLPGDKGKIEFLGTGQFFVVSGTHATGARRAWDGGRIPDIETVEPEEFEALWSALRDEYEPKAEGTPTVPDANDDVLDALAIGVTDETIADLRSAVEYLDADDRVEWINVGQALRSVGEAGRELWREWSATSSKYEPDEIDAKWQGFRATRTTYRAIFARAQRAGWVNPRSGSANSSSTASAAWGEPLDVMREIAAPPFDETDVPAAIGRLARQYARASGFDASGVIVAAIAAAAAMIDDRMRLAVRPQSKWAESARLWVLLIGRPADGKSPCMRVAIDPIRAMHADLLKTWQVEADATPEGNPKPPRPSLITGDTTIEALGETLAANPRGVLVATEEIAHLMRSVDGYRDGSTNRGAWLQLFDGGPMQIDRIKRGASLVPNFSASIVACGTPGGIADALRHVPEDGFVQRLLPVLMAPPTDPEPDAPAVNVEGWHGLLAALYEATSCPDTASRVELAPEARAMFDAEVREIRGLVDATYDICRPLSAHFGKHAGLIARVALVFHMVQRIDAHPGARPTVLGLGFDALDGADTEGDLVIGADTMALAIRFMRKARKHAAGLFLGVLKGSSAYDLAQSLARALAASTDRPARIGRAWMSTHCREFRGAEERAQRAAVAVLEDADWLRADGSRTYSGWPSGWRVNPAIFSKFADEGARHRARRALVREAVLTD